jgi:uncharacterized protein
VDIGVHQDGLVHVSELSDRFIRDPAEVVKTGDKLKVRVISVDKARRRIALSAKTQPSSGSRPRPESPRSSDAQSRGGFSARPGFDRGGSSNNRQPPRSGFSANPFAGL